MPATPTGCPARTRRRTAAVSGSRDVGNWSPDGRWRGPTVETAADRRVELKAIKSIDIRFRSRLGCIGRLETALNRERIRMPRTESNPIHLGAPAPDFLLPDADGRLHRLEDFAAKPALLVAFISNRCPFVVLIREELARIGRDYAEEGFAIVAINANDAATHPEETLARIGQEVSEQGYGFPYLKDADQSVAKAYGAACTPDLFLYDAERRLAYHGQFDDARPGNGGRSDRHRSPAVDRGGAGWRPAGRGPGAVDRLQHQVAGRQRAGQGRAPPPEAAARAGNVPARSQAPRASRGCRHGGTATERPAQRAERRSTSTSTFSLSAAGRPRPGRRLPRPRPGRR